ncbi:MAG: hypothetical protein OWS74_01105 [Firmicutes bacterium]|nr:hypothetical protein [Bacillota bacterium]
MTIREQRIVHIAPLSWTILGIWFWLPVFAGIAWIGLHQMPYCAQRWITGTLWFFFAVLGYRGLTAAVYNSTVAWHHGILLAQSHGIVLHVSLKSAWRIVVVEALGFGWIMGLLAGLLGMLNIFSVPVQMLIWGIGLPVVSAGYGFSLIILYNKMLVPHGRTVVWMLWQKQHRWFVAGLQPHAVRRTVSSLSFAGGMLYVTLGMGIFIGLLTLLAHHIPGGWFGLAAAYTGWAAALGVWALASWGLGWWFYLGTWLYNHWLRKILGLPFVELSYTIAV